MTIQIPDWLSATFVQSILRKSENDPSIIVNNVEAKAATAAGDNYMSDMIRASVEYTRDQSDRTVMEKKSLILKVAPKNGGLNADLARKTGAFMKETEMLDNTLVRMNEVLNEKDYRLSPRALYAKVDEPSYIVMEDLTELGFVMANRQAGLDLQHCVLAMRGLAKLHASSVAIYEKDPNSIKLYRRGIYHKDSPEELKKFIRDGMKVLGNEIADWTELDSCYSEKILKLSEVCYDKAAEFAMPRDDEFNVINHGDCWVNNMLFRYNDEGKVVDHIFVDFQISVWSSPAIDLLHFLSTSPTDEVLRYHCDELLDEYIDTLTKTMLRIGCSTKPPSVESLRRSMRERELFTVLSSTLGLPFALVDKIDVVSLSEMMPENGHINPVYGGLTYRKIMVRRLKEWNSRGILDAWCT